MAVSSVETESGEILWYAATFGPGMNECVHEIKPGIESNGVMIQFPATLAGRYNTKTRIVHNTFIRLEPFSSSLLQPTFHPDLEKAEVLGFS